VSDVVVWQMDMDVAFAYVLLRGGVFSLLFCKGGRLFAHVRRWKMVRAGMFKHHEETTLELSSGVGTWESLVIFILYVSQKLVQFCSVADSTCAARTLFHDERKAQQ
jgi:hypothetical protein